MLSFLLEISIDLHEIGWSFAYHCISGMMILSHSCRIFGLYNASKWPASGDKLHSSNQSSQTLGNALWTSLVKAMASLSVIWHECIYSLSITIKLSFRWIGKTCENCTVHFTGFALSFADAWIYHFSSIMFFVVLAQCARRSTDKFQYEIYLLGPCFLLGLLCTEEYNVAEVPAEDGSWRSSRGQMLLKAIS